MGNDSKELAGDTTGSELAPNGTSGSPARASLAKAFPKVEQRIYEIEDRLAGGMLPRQAERWARQKWGISRRSAYRYVSAVYKIWSAESASESQDQRRARCRLMLHDAYDRCINMTGFYVDQHGESHEPDQPDMKAAAKVLELILKFEGVIEPDNTTINVNLQQNIVEVMQREYGLGDGEESD